MKATVRELMNFTKLLLRLPAVLPSLYQGMIVFLIDVFHIDIFARNLQPAKKLSNMYLGGGIHINTIDLWDMEANTSYEYEVGAVCGDFESPYSAIGELQTMETQTPLYECGAQPKDTLNTNQEPLPELKVGDKVHTLTVEVTITKVTGGNGTFSGEAEARLKIFHNALLSLVFKDIRVNKDYWLIGGYFEAVNGGVELPKGAQEGVDVLGDVLSESQGGGISNDYKAPPPDTTTFVAQETITIPDAMSLT